MLFATPDENDGDEGALPTAGDTRQADDEPEHASVWNYLDWDEAQDFFDRLDREGVPSAPLQADDV